jgi:hypothetical protein
MSAAALLRSLGQERVERGFTPESEHLGMAGFAALATHPSFFCLSQAAARTLPPMAGVVASKETLGRMPRFAAGTFRRRIS